MHLRRRSIVVACSSQQSWEFVMTIASPGDKLQLVWLIPAKNYRGKPSTSEDGHVRFIRRREPLFDENIAVRDGMQLSIFCACHPTHGRFAIFVNRFRMESGYLSVPTLLFPGENYEVELEIFRQTHSAVMATVLA
jgi:hypothetical protein